MENKGRMFYVLIERLYNRRISLARYEDDGGYTLQFVTCLSKKDAAEYIEEKKAAEQPNKLIRGRILVTNMALSAEAVRAVSQLYQMHEKYAEERQQMRRKRQQVAVTRAVADENVANNGDKTQ